MIDTHIIRRLLIYLVGLFILSVGLALFLQSGLGLPVNSSVAYVLSRIISVRYSICLIIVNVLLVLVQIIVLRKNFRAISLLQIPLSFLFGYFVDLTCRLTAVIQPIGYVSAFAVMVLGIVLLGLGLSLYIQMDLIPMPLEGLALAVTDKLRRFPLYSVKRALDTTLLLVSVTGSLIFLHHLEGVREGTVFTALFAGKLMGIFMKYISLPILKGFIYQNSRIRAQEAIMEKHISGKTQTLALIGSPVGHSGSPAMYNYCFEKLGFDCAYVAFDVPLEKLHDAMTGIKALNFRGMNITMPCKSAVIEYMDELSPAAKLMGACNTAVNENGRWIGHNTDGIGYVESLKSEGIDVSGKRITIMGAGGAGTAIAVACALSGAKTITIFNIKDSFYSRAEKTAENICKELHNCTVRVHDLSDESALFESVKNSDILANTTRAGMAPDTDKMPLNSTEVLRKGLVVTDTIYNPKETKLLREAKTAGCVAIGGTGMLVYQAAAAFKLYTGADMPVNEVRSLFFS